jgi:hypothetical protein
LKAAQQMPRARANLCIDKGKLSLLLNDQN